jgi:outer membrane protein OmpA-like peptidoglycan-associated protein
MNKQLSWGNKIKDPTFFFKMFVMIVFPVWVMMMGIWNYNIHNQTTTTATNSHGFSWEAAQNTFSSVISNKAVSTSADITNNGANAAETGPKNNTGPSGNTKLLAAALVTAKLEKKKAVAGFAIAAAAEKERTIITRNKMRNERVAGYFKFTKELLVYNYDYKSIDYDKADTATSNSIERYASGGESFSKIVIIGHTDNIGSEAYNIKLGLKRAEQVKRELVTKGFDAKKITTISYGKSKPIDTNSTPEGRANNRRAEILFLDSGN